MTKSKSKSLDSNLKDDIVTIGNHRYHLEKNLGAGKRGVVFLARDLETRALVCIKKETSLDRASLEAAAINQCYKPHKTDVTKNGHNYYYSQPFFTGQTLKSIRHTLTLYEKLVVAQKLKIELIRLHNLGYLHRDLKSDNVIVDVSGPEIEVHIIDMGRSVQREDKQNLLINENSIHLLLQDHAAPEFIYGGPIDTHSDIYSYGKILRALFPGQSKLVQSLISNDLSEREAGFDMIEARFERLFDSQKQQVLKECRSYLHNLEDADLTTQEKTRAIKQVNDFMQKMKKAEFSQPGTIREAQKEYVELKQYLKSINEMPKTLLQRIRAFFSLFAPPGKTMAKWLEEKAGQFFTRSSENEVLHKPRNH